jgi:response regulator RpfG family c-di-GMP phosphodiesterase
MTTDLSNLLEEFDESPPAHPGLDEKPSILVIDDDIGIQRALSKSLSTIYRVLTASNGLDGIDLFQ